jgi:hypothetical protein
MVFLKPFKNSLYLLSAMNVLTKLFAIFSKINYRLIDNLSQVCYNKAITGT